MPVGPRTVVEMADSARDRFEAELQRARSRTADRPKSDTQQGFEESVSAAPAPAPTDDAPAPVIARDPLRPAVGSVISLPPRIKITESTMIGGARPAPPVHRPRTRSAVATRSSSKRADVRVVPAVVPARMISAARSCRSARRASKPS